MTRCPKNGLLNLPHVSFYLPVVHFSQEANQDSHGNAQILFALK